MTSSSSSEGGSGLGPIGTQIASHAIQALPPEIQDLIRPGKQSDRINRAIGYAARIDPLVLELHRQYGARHVKTLADIRELPIEQMDKVAERIARRYRRRAALTGALMGLPGGPWAIAAAGLDVQLTAVYAVRMAAGVAQSYGYDTTLPEELAQLAEVLALVAGVDSLRGIGNWLTREGLTHLLPEILPKLLVRIGAQVTKEQTARVVGRLIPGVGALIGGIIDYTFIRVAGAKSVQFFHHRTLVDRGLAPAQTVEAGAAIAAVPPGAGGAAPPPPAGPPAPVIPHAAPRRRDKPPERIGVYLAIFAVIALLITIAAITVVIVLISNAITGLFH
jgi:hypothetical protein